MDTTETIFNGDEVTIVTKVITEETISREDKESVN